MDDERIEHVIPVIAETLHVDRRERQGLVRVRKIVHEQPVSVDESGREERVSVERVPIGRPVDGPVGVRHEGEVLVVPVLEERLVVEKRLVLVEELRIRRETRITRVPARVVLRREELVVERLDPVTGAWSSVETPDPDPSPVPAGADVDA